MSEGIPKYLHYVWFGKPLDTVSKMCMNTWHKHMPDYLFVKWDEKNCDFINAPLFVKDAFKAKKYAFVSDYFRTKALYEQGGIYLDTDMYVVKPFDDLLLDCEGFLGYESKEVINGAIIGLKKGNWLSKKMLDWYQVNSFDHKNPMTIPLLITKLLKESGLSEHGYQEIGGIKLFPTDFFYPYPQEDSTTEKNFLKYATAKTYTIHLWNASWINITAKIRIKASELLNKIGLYKPLSYIWRRFILKNM